MKKILVVIIIGLIVIGTIIGFQPSKTIDKDLILAEELMCDRPDSSLQILEKLKISDFGGENRALYALLMTQAQFKNYISVNSDSIFKIAYDYFLESNDSLRKVQIYFYRGRFFEKSNNEKEAIKYYQNASVVAKMINNYDLLILIYNRWGLLLRKQSLYEDALAIQNKALRLSDIYKDTLKQVFNLRDIGNTFTTDKKSNQALFYYRKALNLAELINNSKRISEIYNNMGFVYKCLSKYDSAMYYVNKSITLISDSVSLYSKFSLKGDLFILKQHYDSARYYLDLGRRAKNLISEASYCSLMSKLEERLGNYKEALVYSNKYIDYVSKIVDSERETTIAELQKKYDYSLIKNENDRLKIARQQMQIVVLVISLIAIIATFLFLYYFYRKRSIKRAMKMELDKMQHYLMNEKSNYLKEKTIEVQRNLIKEKELSMELSQKSETLKQHEERERELKDYIFQMEAIVQKINTFNSMKPLQRSKSESQFTLSFQELNDLEEAVNLCFDHFADRLRAEFPKLKDDDIHLCCLLKMKVPNKNILSLLDTNELTLKKRRYRIKHDKMNLPDDVSSLEEFLHNY